MIVIISIFFSETSLETLITIAAFTRELGTRNTVQGKLVYCGGWSIGGWGEEDAKEGEVVWDGEVL